MVYGQLTFTALLRILLFPLLLTLPIPTKSWAVKRQEVRKCLSWTVSLLDLNVTESIPFLDSRPVFFFSQTNQKIYIDLSCSLHWSTISGINTRTYKHYMNGLCNLMLCWLVKSL